MRTDTLPRLIYKDEDYDKV